MTWKSTTFFSRGGDEKTSELVSKVIDRHRDSMNAILDEARQIFEDRKAMITSIQDPELRKSAAR